MNKTFLGNFSDKLSAIADLDPELQRAALEQEFGDLPNFESLLAFLESNHEVSKNGELELNRFIREFASLAVSARALRKRYNHTICTPLGRAKITQASIGEALCLPTKTVGKIEAHMDVALSKGRSIAFVPQELMAFYFKLYRELEQI